MKTTLTIGRSVQVIQMGQPESWNKISIEREFPEGVNIQQAIDDLFLEVEAAHEKHSNSVEAGCSNGILKREVRKSQPDADIRLKYAKAVAANDKEQVDILESLYTFQIGG